ncbi:spore germination protein GerPE [Paenibacillus doosanensis]|uniref:Spore germination protein GerPE n=1 Tax=Paenibacillus konkukensis TaxID=2020716 RepID=A0ABY4RIX7_9BACL|nr:MULTISPECIES: spore germination protein GerPE [Paenibacillus]MCS7464411.1 spore germination protein GerPE [Paenibacillus doosanensis]UQZ82157.1 putative spore germination protein GerPE [Paenibacillus konkukensis]
MQQRISCVGTLHVNTVGDVTALEVGDTERLSPSNYTIAVQREKAIFLESEFDFADYNIFYQPLIPPDPREPLIMNRINMCPNITVRKVNVFLTSASAIVHIGSSQSLKAQSRIKHIRHLLRERPV